MKTLTEKINSLISSEALEVELDMLDNLPDDEDGVMHLSFDDNGGLADGTSYLLMDYTDAQRAELVKRGAAVRRAVVGRYEWQETEEDDRDDSIIYRDELEGADRKWTAMQVAGEVVIAVDDVTQAERELYAVMSAGEAEDEFGLGQGTIRQAINRHQVVARKSGDIWLIRRQDAEARWGKK